MNILAQLPRSIFRLRYIYPNALQQQQARGLLWMTLALLGLVAFGMISTISSGFGFSLQVVVVNTTLTISLFVLQAIVGLGCVLVLVLLNRGNLDAARAGFIFTMYAAAFLVTFFLGGVGPRPWVVSIFIMPQVAAGVLLGRPGMIAMTLLIFGTIGALELFTALDLISYPPDERFGSSSVTFLVANLSGAVMLLIFAGGQRVLLQRNLNLARELAGLTNLSQVIGQNERLGDMLARTVEMIRDQLGYYHVQIFLADEQSDILTLAAGVGFAPSVTDSPQRRVALDGLTLLAEAARSREPLRIADDAPPARRVEFLPATRAQLLVPLWHGDALMGLMDVQSVQADAFAEPDIEALRSIGAQIAIAIQNARLLERVHDLSEERERLVDQLRRNQQELERLSQEASGRNWRSQLEPRTEKLVGYDYKEGAVVAAYNPMALPERGPGGYSPRIEVVEGAQVLVVPIVSRGQALGVMEFRAAAGQIWDDRSVELARTIAQRLALSLDNLRLFEQAQMAVAREQLANQIATLLQARSDVDSLVAVAVDSFQQALGALQTSIRLGIPDSRPASTSLPTPSAPPAHAIQPPSQSIPATTASKNGERR